MKFTKLSWLVVSLFATSASLLGCCGRERAQLSADCTEVGKTGSQNGLEPCLKLAEKYGSSSNNELEIAWSGIQMHCSYDEKLSAARQKECDNACRMMRVFSEGNSTPNGINGNTYTRTALASGECVGGGKP